MSEPVVQFLLRIPASVKQKIEEAAKENNRSTNAEALVRLEKSFEEQESVSLADIQDQMRKLRAEAREMRMLYVEAICEQNKELIEKIVKDAKLK